MKALRGFKLTTAIVALGALALAAPVSAAPRVANAVAPIHLLGIFTGSDHGNGSGHGHGGGGSPNLSYHGGTSDGAAGFVGVETVPKVYLVFWGSQWNGNDTSGEAPLLTSFLKDVGGTSWNNTVTQYCQGVPSGTNCSGGTYAGNPSSVYGGSWFDNATPAPSKPSQSQLAAEAVSAAANFGNLSPTNNANAQYVIATASGNSATGFGTSYCAWHSSTTSSYGDIAYTNLPYITDAGAGCGANFNGLGSNAGITIVEGHEFAETETDQFPSSGWLDGSGAEIGDKCAWNSKTADVLMGGTKYPVQPLWSNAASGGAGGCVMSY